MGGTLTTAATMSMQQTIASATRGGDPAQAVRVGATAASDRDADRLVQWFRGNTAGFGGFFFRAQLVENVNVNGAQCFVGLCASTAALARRAGPSARCST